MILSAGVLGLGLLINTAAAQSGPTLKHQDRLTWFNTFGWFDLHAETTTLSYTRADLFVSLDYPFPPAKLGPLGTLLINPGALVFIATGLPMIKVYQKPWRTSAFFPYPKLIPFALVGTRFRVQCVGYEEKNPLHVRLTTNAVTFEIVRRY